MWNQFNATYDNFATGTFIDVEVFLHPGKHNNAHCIGVKCNVTFI